MADPFIGQISLFSFAFPPKGWAFCNGQLLSIAQNQALFSLLGITYGGNGVTTFALPNLQNRAATSSGQGPGLSPYTLGQVGGETAHSLTSQEMPSHTHAVATASDTTQLSPQGRYWAPNITGAAIYSATGVALMAPNAIGSSGNSQAHPNMQPHLPLNFCIALVGVFPSRD